MFIDLVDLTILGTLLRRYYSTLEVQESLVSFHFECLPRILLVEQVRLESFSTSDNDGEKVEV